MFAPPPWDAPGKKNIFLISLINMEVLRFMIDGLIYNNKEIKFTTPDTPLIKKIFFLFP